MSTRHNHSIIGYDPSKKGKDYTMHSCAYCWFSTRSKSVLTRHIKAEHYDVVDIDKLKNNSMEKEL